MFTLNRRQFVASACSPLLVPRRFVADDAPEDSGKVGFQEITAKSESAVRDGMKWLNRAKALDGGYGVDVGQRSDIGCTAMVGMAMLSRGYLLHGIQKLKVRQIVEFLLKKIKTMPAGNITSETNTQLQTKIGNQAHSFMALLFLSQVMGESHRTKLTREGAQKLVDAVVKSQLADGSWGRTSWAPVLGTVMGWISLRSSHFAGIDVKGSPDRTAAHLIKKMEAQLDNRRHWMHKLYKDAAGIRVLYAMGKEEEPVVKRAFSQSVDLVTKDKTAFNQAGGEEYLAFHLITETMLQKGGEDWATWFPEVRDKIISVQNQDGSWTGHHCITSRTFCTAAACLVLSAPNRFLPISQL